MKVTVEKTWAYWHILFPSIKQIFVPVSCCVAKVFLCVLPVSLRSRQCSRYTCDPDKGSKICSEPNPTCIYMIYVYSTAAQWHLLTHPCGDFRVSLPDLCCHVTRCLLSGCVGWLPVFPAAANCYLAVYVHFSMEYVGDNPEDSSVGLTWDSRLW